MAPAPDLRRDLLRVISLPALTLLLVPLAALLLTFLAETKLDERFLEAVRANIEAAGELGPEQKAEARAFYEANPPSVVCQSSDPELADYRASVCETFGDMWQFLTVKRVSLAALVLGIVALLGSALLGLVAWKAPRAQLATFQLGRWGLTCVSAVEVVVQAALATWLSYWVTALAINVYVPKLILIVAIFAAIGVWTSLSGIFRRVVVNSFVEGELVPRKEGEALWARLEGLAGRVGTAPPANLIAGIDDNFFVAEAPLTVKEQVVSGRSLFVSLPLLRLLSASEADAVLAHELAHFRGGDTAMSSRLGPALVRYDAYLEALGSSFFTLPAFYVVRMFRVFFELARQKEQRSRELRADRVAAETTSTEDFARALLKTTAYSSHRASTEQTLFADDERRASSALALNERISSGLGAHIDTPRFQETIATANVPHPFDSHPPLSARLENIGSNLRLDDCRALVSKSPSSTWADLLPSASQIEGRLWADYESRFVSAHELSLAHRYLPQGDAERAVVEKHFPPTTFSTNSGAEILLTFDAIQLPNGDRLELKEILSLRVDDGNFKTELWLDHVIDSAAGPGPTEINLRSLGDTAKQEAFKQALVVYWQRDQAAREYAQSAEMTEEAA